MNIDRIIDELREQRGRVDAAISALENEKAAPRRTHVWSAESRRKHSLRMKKAVGL